MCSSDLGDLLLVQHAGHDGRGSDGHKGEGTEGKEGTVLVVGHGARKLCNAYPWI